MKTLDFIHFNSKQKKWRHIIYKTALHCISNCKQMDNTGGRIASIISSYRGSSRLEICPIDDGVGYSLLRWGMFHLSGAFWGWGRTVFLRMRSSISLSMCYKMVRPEPDMSNVSGILSSWNDNKSWSGEILLDAK